MQPCHRYAEVNGIRLHYVEQGSGKLVLFAHGFPEFWYEWHAQLADLGRDHRAVAPDLRGYNLSSKPAAVDAYRVHHLVEDLRALAATLTQEPFALVAHDWGGAVAWAFAIQYPQLLSRLIILNSPHPAIFARELSTNPQQQRASQYMRLFQSPEAEDIVSFANFRMLKEAALRGRSPEDVAKYVEAWSQPGAITGGLNYYRAMRIKPPALDGARPAPLPDVDRSAFRVNVRTRVIWGMLDTALMPGNLEGLCEFVPDLDVVRVADASHWIVAERPDLVNQLIREFL
jgi:pimeloyl-ACP methyl ester carboxylesterase